MSKEMKEAFEATLSKTLDLGVTMGYTNEELETVVADLLDSSDEESEDEDDSSDVD